MRKVGNPLTIVGLFAGLTETAGAIVLPFLEGGVQVAYVTFLIAFPTILLLLFFGTLLARPAVLFSPDEHGGAGDYRKAVVDKTERDRVLEAFIMDPELAERLLAWGDKDYVTVSEVIGNE